MTLEHLWRQRTNEELSAARDCIEDYSAEAQKVILDEIGRRHDRKHDSFEIDTSDSFEADDTLYETNTENVAKVDIDDDTKKKDIGAVISAAVMMMLLGGIYLIVVCMVWIFKIDFLMSLLGLNIERFLSILAYGLILIILGFFTMRKSLPALLIGAIAFCGIGIWNIYTMGKLFPGIVPLIIFGLPIIKGIPALLRLRHADADLSLTNLERSSLVKTYANLPTTNLKQLLKSPMDLRPGASEIIQEEIEKRQSIMSDGK